MRLTEEQLLEDDERWHARNVIHELEYCSRYIKDRRDITNLDLHFYMWLFRNALKMITAPKHGKFIGTEYDGYEDGHPVYYEWKCSECGCVFEEEEPTYNYCPNCGAQMEVRANELRNNNGDCDHKRNY